MAHRLEPREGMPYLPPAEVVRRLEAEFSLVHADAEAGAVHVEGMIRQFERMGFPAAIVYEHREMQVAALHLVVADSPDPGGAYLSFVALPGQGLFVGYSSRRHEEAAGPLLRRCCQTLGYEPHLV